MKKTTVFALIIVSLLACQNNESRRQRIVENRMERFYHSQHEWDKLTKQLLENDYVLSNVGKSVIVNSLHGRISDELKKRGIVRIVVSKSDGCTEVEYDTNWTKYPVGTLYLTWSSCEQTETEKGYHRNDSGFIELWGLGEGWMIWTDCDFI